MVSIIIINFNNAEFTIQVIKDAARTLSMPYELIVVDNASTENDLSRLKKHIGNARLIESSKNLGFGKANNLGSKYAKGEYLLFLNNDVIIDSDFISPMINLLRNQQDAAIVGPMLLNQDRSTQISWGWDVSVLGELMNKFFRPYWEKSKRLRKWLGFNRKREVDWVTGAALLMKANAFAEVDGFDENIFMYFEDADICRRTRQLDHKVYFCPDSVLIHFRGGSQNNDKINQDVKLTYRQSQLYYYKKHLSRTSYNIIKGLLMLKFTIKLRTGFLFGKTENECAFTKAIISTLYANKNR